MSMTCRPKWPFLLMCVFHDVRHVEFRGLTGSQRTPGFGGSHGEDYAWAPVLGSFDKLREVGVLSYLFYPLFKCFVMLELI